MAQNLSEPLITNPGQPTSGSASTSTSYSSWYSRNRVKVNSILLILGLSFLAFWYCKEKFLFNHDPKVDEVASFHHEYPASTFSINEDSTILVTATESGKIHAWDIQAKSSILKLDYPGKVTGIDITYDNQYIVASGDDKSVRVFSLKNGFEVAKFLHPGQVIKFQIPRRKLYVVTICGDNELRIWNIEKNKLDSSIVSSWGVITTFDYSGYYYKVAFGTDRGILAVYNTVFLNTFSFKVDLEKPITQVNLSAYEERVSVQFVNNSFAIVTTKSAFFRVKAELDFKFNNSIVKLGKEARYAVVAGDKIEVLDLYYENKIDEFKHGNRVSSVAITSYGYHVISASDDDMIRVWEIGSGKEAISIRSPGKVNNIVLSRDLAYFAAGGDDGYVRVYTLYI